MSATEVQATFDCFSRELLEYDALREIVRRFTGSPGGRALLDELAPSTDLAWIENALAETAEAIAYLDRARDSKAGAPGRIRFSDLPDVREAAARVRIEGAVLDGRELFDLSLLLHRAMEARESLASSGGRLQALVRDLPDLRPLLRPIEGRILPDGNVADDASPELARLRRDRLRQQSAIQESLQRFVQSHRDDGVMQESYVTVRNDRFVVPVVSNRRGRVDGVIHGASGSGQTLFIEPMETIELNNQLVRISEEEAREVHRILREITAVLRQAGPAVPAAIESLTRLDLIFAKADFAIAFDCAIPKVTATGARLLRIRSARHPLLADLFRREKRSVVPVHIELDEGSRTLLITGPNTGGKTVAMKTVGLFALMAQSGLPLPCSEATLPVFDEVLADIGDNQSIAESLSSFSAHVRRLREILDAASMSSLALLDELGRATDPEEGGALGVAVVDRLRRTGAFTLASTHLMALKVYGATTPGVVNGSMGFDEQTLMPTYVLQTGAPGRSAGLAIAGRLGLPPDLIADARGRLSTSERDIAEFLAELHTRLDATRALEADLRVKLASAEARSQELEAAASKKQASLAEAMERKSAELIASFESRAQQAIEEIRANAQSRKAADQAQVAARGAAREMRQALADAVRPGTTATPASPRIAVGTMVRLSGVREPARVRRVLHQGKLEVEAGLLKMQVTEADVLEILPDTAATARLPKGVSFTAGPSWTLSEREINVIGKTADEARDEIERFIDKASLAGVERIRIVHGHGMGVLKRTVAELVTGHPLIDRHETATQAEGGTGATIIWLRA